MRRFVITHPELGIYIGQWIGLGFWTLLDPAGQPAATTFESPEDALEFIRSWDTNEIPDGYYSFNPVEVASPPFATIAELKAAGLKSMLGNMEIDALRYGDVAGYA